VPEVRIALMGAGWIGREHLELVAAHPDATLAAVADVSAEAEALATGRGAAYYRDVEQMLDEVAPDGAIVALPNELHLAAGLACIERGIPVLVEKPIAPDLASATALVEAAEASGVPVLVGHHRRHSPDMQAARRAIRRGDLGEILAVNGMCLVRKHDSYFEAEWRRQPGGGPLLINAIHDIDCFRFLCGEIEAVQAIASHHARGLEVEDTVAASLRFESGALGTFLLSDAVPSPYFWDIASGQALYFPAGGGEDSYVVGGRKGTLTVPSLDLWAHEPGGDWRDPISATRLAVDASRCYANQLDNLVGVVRGEQDPVVTARDATMTLAVTLAIDRAAAEGRTVRVAEMFA
jgi:predicted dehydrogenase